MKSNIELCDKILKVSIPWITGIYVLAVLFFRGFEDTKAWGAIAAMLVVASIAMGVKSSSEPMVKWAAIFGILGTAIGGFIAITP
ncbi:hypothetical protein [Grimontia marina]|uniref:Uncharacterized protein n=1 Tax=Grimontia marina TaxID=646534 RepID=A0A128FDD9_9GAMM|nr:hypothetical protein [Grimontia marina]CZF84832.1 hypothetical protein GMA8713_03268 [Grimontia marina]